MEVRPQHPEGGLSEFSQRGEDESITTSLYPLNFCVDSFYSTWESSNICHHPPLTSPNQERVLAGLRESRPARRWVGLTLQLRSLRLQVEEVSAQLAKKDAVHVLGSARELAQLAKACESTSFTGRNKNEKTRVEALCARAHRNGPCLENTPLYIYIYA